MKKKTKKPRKPKNVMGRWEYFGGTVMIFNSLTLHENTIRHLYDWLGKLLVWLDTREGKL